MRRRERHQDKNGPIWAEHLHRWIIVVCSRSHREKFSHSLSSIKNYFVMMFDILPLKFGLVDYLWDKIMIGKIYETNVSSCCYLNSVKSLRNNNYIIHMHIFTTSVHWNILRNLRKHQIFLSTSDFSRLLPDSLLYLDRLLSLSKYIRKSVKCDSGLKYRVICPLHQSDEISLVQ
jgi:hypothetical protein